MPALASRMRTYDYLVIGSGVAGLSLALKAAAQHSVALVTKMSLQESNSSYAQGGIAAVWDHDDTFDAHIEDTLAAGAGLCHPDVVEDVVREGPDRVRELIELGVNFSRRPGRHRPDYDLGLEGGHSHRRILHATDATGQELMRVLTCAIRRQSNIAILEHHTGIDLLTRVGAAGQECWGAYVLDAASGRVRTLRSRVTALCTGGSGKVYLYTSNPDVATGDGVAMAYRAGAEVGNLEFFQFHPTCLVHPQATSFLISEAVRGEGAILCRPDGVRFMRDYDPRGELAPRDIVARAIDREMKLHGLSHVLLDISHRPAKFIRARFPVIWRRCRECGFDLTREPIPVVPAAHYMCGGVVADRNGATQIDRLYVAGEVAMTGLHGANRLASNSLLEAVVFAHRVFLHAETRLAGCDTAVPAFSEWKAGTAVNSDEKVVIAHTWQEIRRLMWDYVGIVRDNRRLARAQRRIAMIAEEIRDYYWNFLVTTDLLELRNLAVVAELIICCASLRKESRGLHYTLDYPKAGDVPRDTIISRPGGGGR